MQALQYHRRYTPEEGVLWLYQEGNEYASVTGGWGVRTTDNRIQYYNDGSASLTLTKESDHMLIAQAYAAGNLVANVSPLNKAAAAGYTSLKVEYEIVSAGGNSYCDIQVDTSARSQALGTYYQRIISGGSPSSSARTIATVDISTLSDDAYVYIDFTSATTAGSITIKIYKVWLE